ncbi:MAG: sporulation integral membrane protein YtvI [Lachnospiraceae bacterium]|nr:sporulation integral membrane protein YtvI [Lachnospiraceae bacterium]
MKKSTKYWKISVNLVLMAVLIVFCIWLLPKILVYFMPFVIAAIIALIANPLVRFLEKKIRIARKAGTAMVIIVVIAVVVLFLYLIISNLIIQIVGLARLLPELWESTSTALRSFREEIRHYFVRLPLPVREWSDSFMEGIADNIGDWLKSTTQIAASAETGGETGTNVGSVLVNIIMGILASYFFLADKDSIVAFLEKHIPGKVMARWDLVYKTMKSAVGGYFLAQLKIMVVVYLELFVGLLILGVNYSFLIAFLIALLDFLPFFGTGAVMLPWAVIALIRQDYRLAVGLLIVWGLSQAIRQLIQPKVVGDSIGLKPIPTLFFLFLGFKIGGAFGLIMGVPIGMVIINLVKAGVFSNFKYSMILLARGLENLRVFSKEELAAEGIDTTEHSND